MPVFGRAGKPDARPKAHNGPCTGQPVLARRPESAIGLRHTTRPCVWLSAQKPAVIHQENGSSGAGAAGSRPGTGAATGAWK